MVRDLTGDQEVADSIPLSSKVYVPVVHTRDLSVANLIRAKGRRYSAAGKVSITAGLREIMAAYTDGFVTNSPAY